MKALLLSEYRQLRVEDVPEPTIEPNEVLIRVKACGICGSDVHGYDGTSGRRIPPIIMGHEASGEVARVGSTVKRVREGDRVTFDSMISCQKCFFCRRGQPNLCDDRRVLGVSCEEYRRNGAFAEFVAVPEHIVFPLPAGLSYEEAALIEPVSVAVHAVGLTPVTLGDTAVVVGAGMIGLLTLQALRLAGAGKVIAADLEDDRLAVARDLGADETLNPRHQDVPAMVKERTEGRGADVVMEAVGSTPSVKMAMESVRKGGTVTLIGNISPTVEFPLQLAVTKEYRVQGSCASANDYPKCLELMGRGAIKVTPIISATVPLEEGPAMFDRLYRREAGLTKVILQP